MGKSIQLWEIPRSVIDSHTCCLPSFIFPSFPCLPVLPMHPTVWKQGQWQRQLVVAGMLCPTHTYMCRPHEVSIMKPPTIMTETVEGKLNKVRWGKVRWAYPKPTTMYHWMEREREEREGVFVYTQAYVHTSNVKRAWPLIWMLLIRLQWPWANWFGFPKANCNVKSTSNCNTRVAYCTMTITLDHMRGGYAYLRWFMCRASLS